jgi:hypothetical protein
VSIIYPADITINRGSDWEDIVPLKNADGTPFDLLNWTPSIYDASSQLTGLISLTVMDEASGLVKIRIEWSETLQVGVMYQFRVRLFNDPDDTTTNAIGVIYQ